MYCRECGEKLVMLDTHCPICGVRKGLGEEYCGNCGRQVDTLTQTECFKCGEKVREEATIDIREMESPKGKLETLLLALFLGGFGAHRFYVGKYITAIIQLLVFPLIAILNIAQPLISNKIGYSSLPEETVTSIGYIEERFAFTLLIFLAVAILVVIIDIILISIGKFRDGKGRRITRWHKINSEEEYLENNQLEENDLEEEYLDKKYSDENEEDNLE